MFTLKYSISAALNRLVVGVVGGVSCALLAVVAVQPKIVFSQDVLPIADAHVHYSHDSVEMTPPARVIELMRNAKLKFALVSSSDDSGTQLLAELAPELIVPSLRPYRRRGETGTWFTDPKALEYVERLLEKNRYAAIGEFHLFGESADLPIPRRIVELAEEHNLLLHAHSDAEAVERLLAQSDKVKVIWAHSGFDDPAEIAKMLSKHDRLWADLAFRSEVGRGGELSDAWRQLFEAYPNRMMLGTDTYTPERMFFIPEHADSARTWLSTLSDELAEKVAWRNAHELIMPMWLKNQASDDEVMLDKNSSACEVAGNADFLLNDGGQYMAKLQTLNSINVSEPVKVRVTVCGEVLAIKEFMLDASMPAHGHGTNYLPSVEQIEQTPHYSVFEVEGLVMHMPGQWQWDMEIVNADSQQTLTHEFMVR